MKPLDVPAEANLEQAVRDLERLRALRGVVAAKDIQRAETAVAVARKEQEQAAGRLTLLGAPRRATVSSWPARTSASPSSASGWPAAP